MFGRSLLRVCHRLCTSAESNSSVLLQRLQENEKLRDYEYCQLIERELKRDAVLPAVNTFLQSHLHSVVLDAQTYNSIFAKMQQHNFDVGYVEVLYRLYRQHLSPNPLMSKMMEVLVGSPDLHSLVKRDYEYLKMELPKAVPRGRRLSTLKRFSEEDLKDPKDKIKIDSVEIQPREDPTGDKAAALSNVRVTEQLIKMLNPLANCDINLYDLKLQFYSEEEQDRMHNSMMYDQDSDEQVDDEGDDQDISLGDILSNVKSIRIGRIEITHKKDD